MRLLLRYHFHLEHLQLQHQFQPLHDHISLPSLEILGDQKRHPHPQYENNDGRRRILLQHLAELFQTSNFMHYIPTVTVSVVQSFLIFAFLIVYVVSMDRSQSVHTFLFIHSIVDFISSIFPVCFSSVLTAHTTSCFSSTDHIHASLTFLFNAPSPPSH